jgi:metal-responsive CopG/Arc/MetJ family transcriptional regulator
MPRENLSVSLPPKMRLLIEKEARRRKRSRSAVVRDAVQTYFRLRQIKDEEPSGQDRAAIADGKRAYRRGDYVRLGEWRHAVGLGDH